MKSIAPLALAALSLLVLPSLRADEGGAAFEVKVPGMKCAGCAMSVSEELKKLDQVTEVYVDPKTKTALVSTKTAEGPGEEAVAKAVKEAGYEAKGYAKLKKTFAEAKATLSGGKG